MKRHVLAFMVLLVLGYCSSASAGVAEPTLDQALTHWWWSTPMVHDIHAVRGIQATDSDFVTLTGDSSQQTIEVTLLFEAGMYASMNRFGIYSPRASGEGLDMLLLFNGAHRVGDTLQVHFDLDAGTALVDINGDSQYTGLEVSNVGDTFGFFVSTPDRLGDVRAPRFFTDSLLNPDTTTIEHGLIYDTGAIRGAIEGDPSIVVAFEDLLAGHSDWDYRDMVVGLSGVQHVPEPATIVLLGLGLTSFFIRRK